jgi:4Fe-4S ferredoxin
MHQGRRFDTSVHAERSGVSRGVEASARTVVATDNSHGPVVSEAENKLGADCSGRPGRFVPVIDRNRCEAKSKCVDVCPYHVFELRALTSEDRARLSLVGRLKAWTHGGRQAFAVRSQDCHACGLCVTACPEQAIKLVAAAAP